MKDDGKRMIWQLQSDWDQIGVDRSFAAKLWSAVKCPLAGSLEMMSYCQECIGCVLVLLNYEAI